MPEKDLNITLQVAQRLLDHLAEPMNSQLRALLDHAKKGTGKTVDVIKLLSRHDNIRLWMDEQTSMESEAEGGELRGEGYVGLAGTSNMVSATQKWVCPENARDHWMLVIQEGEPPPTCKEHNIGMIRESQ
jgi:hypothetical protein